MQRWPVEKNAELITLATASGMSASASTTVGFLPPISSCTRTRRLAASTAIPLPVATEPVNEIAFTAGFVTISWPTFDPGPVMKLSAPLVTPASSSASTSRSAQSGARSEGLRTTALPAISAGAVFQAGMAMGKFQGVISPTTPSGRRSVWMTTRSRSEGVSWPLSRAPFAAVVAQDVDRTVHLAARLGQRLALLAGHVAGDAVGSRLEDVGGAMEDLAALRRRDGCPGGLRLARRVDRLPRVGGVATRGSCRSPRRCRPDCASRTCGPRTRRPTRPR